MVNRIKSALWVAVTFLLIEIVFAIYYSNRYIVPLINSSDPRKYAHTHDKNDDKLWHPPHPSTIPPTREGDMIRYGRNLIEHTAVYLGPNGKVFQISNGMNCQNCHLHAGTKAYAANYSAVASTYPRFRHRSGTIESMEKRVNDCIERSLNGKALPENSHEMKSIIAYFKWLGQQVPRGTTPERVSFVKLPYLLRAANPTTGKIVYSKHCSVCHGKNGEGLKSENGIEWKYPPLWGPLSYNTGAGLFRLSNFAAFVKANMPYGINYENPVLSDEEAWDVAAFVNSMPRPHKEFLFDWPDPKTKPIDFPFGPYTDGFSEVKHKYGPFQDIIAAKKK